MLFAKTLGSNVGFIRRNLIGMNTAFSALRFLVSDERIIHLSLCIELLLQPQFPAGDANSKSGFRSVSGRREPDIVMMFREGKRRRWYVLDAKYRTTRSALSS